MGTDFSYIKDGQIVYYTLVVPQEHNELFASLCQDYLTDIEICDNFILSFFHEIGHYMTDDDWDEEDWDKYYIFTEKLRSKAELKIGDYKRYYKYPIELSATI